MSLRISVAALVFGTTLAAGPAYAQSGSIEACAALGTQADNTKLAWCVAMLSKELLANKTAPVAIPEGLVVASLHKCSELPGGWIDFNEGNGRMIVGAGSHAKNPFAAGLTEHEAYEIGVVNPASTTIGGEEQVTLGVANLPAHSHKLVAQSPNGEANDTALGNNQIARSAFPGGHDPMYTLVGKSTGASLGNSSSVGDGAAVNNMPPYIALYFCKKH